MVDTQKVFVYLEKNVAIEEIEKMKNLMQLYIGIGPHSSSLLVGLDLEYRSICTKLMMYFQILADFKGKIEWAISFI